MRTSRTLVAVAAFLALAVALGACALTRPDDSPQVQARLGVAALLSGDGSGFARALAPRPFAFPADHGPHPEYRNEWWYFTGNLATPAGRRFGFQLTFFRTALSARPAARDSAWASNQVYMAHFALSDVDGGRFYAFERFSRGALGLAGAEAAPFRVWLHDWSAAGGEQEALPTRLRAAQGGAAIDLLLAVGKPVVLQGEAGLSRKGPEAGNASYYYSHTRLPTTGSVRVGEETFAVAGNSWLDREWSTSALGEELEGWDWFALQLDDGREVMFYRLRRRDGASDPLSAGTVVAADGTSRSLGAADCQLAVVDRWRSPRGGTFYPARWRLRLPAEDIDLEVTPLLADQELDLSVRYWEGAVSVRGTSAGRPIAGRGYVELTGYADRESGRQ